MQIDITKLKIKNNYLANVQITTVHFRNVQLQNYILQMYHGANFCVSS